MLNESKKHDKRMLVNKKRNKKDVREDFLVALSREQTGIFRLELGQQRMPNNPKKRSDPLPALITVGQLRKINKTQPQNLLCYFFQCRQRHRGASNLPTATGGLCWKQELTLIS